MTQPTEEVLRPCPSLETMRAYAEAAMQNGFRVAIDVAHGAPLSFAWKSDWFKNNPPESAIPEHEWNARPSPDEATVELVARAIYDVSPQLGHRVSVGPPANYAVDWEHAAESFKDEAREQARAALTAISEEKRQ
jgi:hypothetical protein